MNEPTKIFIDTEFNDDVISSSVRGISKEVIRLKDEGVREALIKLGWTPPKISQSKSLYY